ncbi:hypothetical protein B566_EDAN002249 [Ephemera danica]|nr:hypothetical protein B566_EDAN002249 [Ephemera danica]
MCPAPKAVSCALDVIPFSVGATKVVCGRLYMLSWIAKTLDDALLTCCSLNMTLVSMEDATKSQCLADYYKCLIVVCPNDILDEWHGWWMPRKMDLVQLGN